MFSSGEDLEVLFFKRDGVFVKKTGPSEEQIALKKSVLILITSKKIVGNPTST